MRPLSKDTKHLCVRMAARLMSASRLDAVPDALEGRLGRRAERPPYARGPENQSRKLGIWEPGTEDKGTAYVRSAEGEPWSLWADIQRIEPKSGRKRVVLLGESTARGFFYDPMFNPAAALKTILESVAGSDCIEIVDLARTDQLLDDVLALAHAAVALRPDAIVVFAGNNWCMPGTLPGGKPEEIARILRFERSWTAVTRFVEARTRETVQAFLRSLGTLVREHRIPFLFILPEFNLLDWHNEYMGPSTVPNAAWAKRWREVRNHAEQAVNRGDIDRAIQLVNEMAELAVEPDILVTELLARITHARGDREAARQLFECARDLSLGLPVPRSPRCFSVIQETVRSFATSEGVILVDLPKRFAEYLGGALPDRNLFHDYCHLTIAGIQLAMASAAEQLLPILDLPTRTWKELNQVDPGVPPEVAAQAHVLAAIHNARWGQGHEIVHYHFSEALRLSSQSIELLQLYLDFHIRRTPALLCRSFHHLLNLGNAAVAKYCSLATASSRGIANVALIEAILDVLESVNPGAKQATWKLFNEEYGVGAQPCDLLDPSLSTGGLGELSLPQSSNGAYYKATDLESHFQLFCVEVQPLALHLVCRMRAPIQSGGAATLLVNHRELLQFAVTANWGSVCARIDPSLLSNGLNSIVIRWPENSELWDDRAHQIADQLEQEAWPDIFARYGEVHSFSARTLDGE